VFEAAGRLEGKQVLRSWGGRRDRLKRGGAARENCEKIAAARGATPLFHARGSRYRRKKRTQ